MTLLPHRHTPPQLVEEVQQEVRGLVRQLGRETYHGSFAVGGDRLEAASSTALE